MKESIKVYGIAVRGPRMTKAAAFLLAAALAVPVFLILNLIDWLWF
ncbi:MAG: hypothetical protein KUG70_00550 [Rhodobacteraceae bacterium]|nr:hypothetical protein [Paracoccaceae bacterium]